MSSPPSRTGLLVSAVGGLAVAIGVFMPWYGVSITQAAVDSTSQQLARISSQYGLAGSALSSFGRYANGLVGHELFSLSGHQALTRISVVLLVIGVSATVGALFALAQTSPALPANAGGLLVLAGATAALLVAYRILTPPAPSVLLTISIKPAAWICLLGGVAIAAGGLWPRESEAAPSAADAGVWSELSGWTPGA